MEKDFESKEYWALILGGSTGLGLASAIKLSNHGMNICIVHRDSKSEMNSISKSFEEIKSNKVKFLAFNADAVLAEKRTSILLELKEMMGNGKIRCLLHSIAKGNLKPMISKNDTELQKDDFMLTFEYMAVSLYEWSKDLLHYKMFCPDSRIISFTSEGNTKAFKNYAAVSAAKMSLEAITRNLALELAPLGIRSNCIQAGVTDTKALRMIPGNEKLKEIALSKNPFHRLTSPEDVANVVYLLCKDEAAWINGIVLRVDGGESIG